MHYVTHEQDRLKGASKTFVFVLLYLQYKYFGRALNSAKALSLKLGESLALDAFDFKRMLLHSSLLRGFLLEFVSSVATGILPSLSPSDPFRRATA